MHSFFRKYADFRTYDTSTPALNPAPLAPHYHHTSLSIEDWTSPEVKTSTQHYYEAIWRFLHATEFLVVAALMMIIAGFLLYTHVLVHRYPEFIVYAFLGWHLQQSQLEFKVTHTTSQAIMNFIILEIGLSVFYVLDFIHRNSRTAYDYLEITSWWILFALSFLRLFLFRARDKHKLIV